MAIGDTLSENSDITYTEIPRFPPECFVYIHNPQPSNYKRFQSGIEQLVQEGLVHPFAAAFTAQKSLILGAVGPLQFDLVQYRLKAEYDADSRLEQTPWTIARWVTNGYPAGASTQLPFSTKLVKDAQDRDVLLFESEWHLSYFRDNNKNLELTDLPA
jgi:peptide chain release factor 3